MTSEQIQPAIDLIRNSMTLHRHYSSDFPNTERLSLPVMGHLMLNHSTTSSNHDVKQADDKLGRWLVRCGPRNCE